MSDVVFVKALRVPVVIGVYEWERRLRQDLVVDLEMETDIRAAAANDDIGDTPDYKAVSKRVQAHIRDSRCRLVEALAEQVAALVLEEPTVRRVRVTLSKPGAVRGAKSVGVVIERAREPDAEDAAKSKTKRAPKTRTESKG